MRLLLSHLSTLGKSLISLRMKKMGQRKKSSGEIMKATLVAVVGLGGFVFDYDMVDGA